MGLVMLVVFSLFLAKAYCFVGEINHKTCSTEFQVAGNYLHQFNKSGIHLTLHHVHGPCSPLVSSQPPLTFSDVLARDEARVRALNSRLAKINTTTSSTSKSDGLRQKSVSVPLNSGTSIGTGNYYVTIGLGTPTKSYAMVVDTGSSFTWLQCQPCAVYCHPQAGPVFDPKASKTHSLMSCDTSECSSLEDATLNAPSCSEKHVCIYSASYGDGSYSVGYLSRDTLTLAPTQTRPGFVYGCGEDNQGLFGRAAGLIGLARNDLSMLGQLSPKFGYVFSYCLPTTTSIGSLSIGRSSFDPSHYKFTPLLTNSLDPTLYFLRLVGITVSGKLLQVPATQYKTPTIIDSGTVITRLPMTVYTALQKAFVKGMSKYARAEPYSILDTCFKGSASSLGMGVPEVKMIFLRGAELKLEASNVVVDVGKGVSCLAFAGNSGTGGVAIIGNRQQEKFTVAYDVSNSRIGFAAGGCR